MSIGCQLANKILLVADVELRRGFSSARKESMNLGIKLDGYLVSPYLTRPRNFRGSDIY